MKTGFVNIFGRPNAGKSTLLNALMGEKLAIVSSKVQTTRHRIKAILTDKDYQVIISDTPGIIEPRYKLHENWEECNVIFTALKLKVPAIVVINKIDRAPQDKIKEAVAFFEQQPYCKSTLTISASSGINIKNFLRPILALLPEGEPYYSGDDISDLPTKFFVSELIREKIYELSQDEIPYHSAVLVREFKEKTTLIKIVADIIVHRETQKVILIGEGGSMIKKIGSAARKDIEAFLQQKVFLELFIKVKPKWRENDLQLKEYGY